VRDFEIGQTSIRLDKQLVKDIKKLPFLGKTMNNKIRKLFVHYLRYNRHRDELRAKKEIVVSYTGCRDI